MLKSLKQHSLFLTLSFILGILALCVKIFQHITYNTGAYDLGIRANILYNISNHCKIYDGIFAHHGFFAHFHPISILLAPLTFIFGSVYLLLIIKALVVFFSVYLVYLISLKLKIGKEKTILIVFLFITNQFFLSQFSFDFHPETIGIPLILLGLYLLMNDNKFFFLPFLLLALLKEDTVVVWLGMGLYLSYEKKTIMPLVVWIVGSIVFVAVVFSLIFPYTGGGLKTMWNIHYANSLNTFSLDVMFKRLWSVVRIILSTGGVILFAPIELIPAIVPLFEHLSSSYFHRYLLDYQYSDLIIPFIVFSMINGIRYVKRDYLRVMVVVAFFFNLLYLPDFFPLRQSFKRIETIDSLICVIPGDVSVSACNSILPHLCERDSISLIPFNKASYIIIDLEKGNVYPLEWDKRYTYIDTLLGSGYITLFKKDGIYLLKRVSYPSLE